MPAKVSTVFVSPASSFRVRAIAKKAAPRRSGALFSRARFSGCSTVPLPKKAERLLVYSSIPSPSHSSIAKRFSTWQSFGL